MISRESCHPILAVVASALLLTSGTAGIAFAATPAAAAPTDKLATEYPDDSNVVEKFTERLSTVETAQFTRTTEITVGNETTTSTERIQVDFDDSQLRSETVDGEFNITTIQDDGNVTQYNADKNRVTGAEVTGSSVLPRLDALANESMFDYEYGGVDVVDGELVYELEPVSVAGEQMSGDAAASMTVYVNMDTYFPVQIESESNVQDDEFSSTVAYEDVTLNEEIPDSTFELDLPDDVEDLRNDSGPDVTRYDTYDDVVSNTNHTVPPADLTEDFSFDSAATFEGENINSLHLTYTAGEESVSVVVYTEPRTQFNHSDSDRFESVDIGDTTGYLSTHEDFVSLYVEGDQPYRIHGQIDQETATTIAETLIDE